MTAYWLNRGCCAFFYDNSDFTGELFGDCQYGYSVVPNEHNDKVSSINVMCNGHTDDVLQLNENHRKSEVKRIAKKKVNFMMNELAQLLQ